MTYNYLSLEEILRLHFQLIEDYGGSHGVRDENRLLSVVSSPKQETFGELNYKTVYEKAAVYLRNIVGDRPFIDGNKRSAVTTCGIFLSRNRVSLTASAIDLENFTVKVATDNLSITEIATWIEVNSESKT